MKQLYHELSSDPFPVDRSQDFQLKWSSTKDGKPVFAMVGEGAGNSYHCKFVDDGSAAIPSSILQNFAETGYVEENEVPEIHVWKYRYTYFQPPGAPAPILLVMESGWYIEVAFQ